MRLMLSLGDSKGGCAPFAGFGVFPKYNARAGGWEEYPYSHYEVSRAKQVLGVGPLGQCDLQLYCAAVPHD